MRRSLVAVVAMAIALPACAGDPERATTSDPQTNAAAQVKSAERSSASPRFFSSSR